MALNAIANRPLEVGKTAVRIELGMDGDVITQHSVADLAAIPAGRALPIQNLGATASKSLPAPADHGTSRR